MNGKMHVLRGILSGMGSAVTAYSGGADSTILLKAAHDTLGEKVLAVTARSVTYQKSEYRYAVEWAKKAGIKHRIIETGELNDPAFVNNSPERCYYCKKELFCRLKEIADREGYLWVIYGATASDMYDFRPGHNAAAELGVRAPLKEAGFTKDDVRRLLREMGIDTWNKPATACLASRIPYGNKITKERLGRVELAEEYIKGLGFRNVRVRIYDTLARIEIDKEGLRDILAGGIKEEIVTKLKELGFTYVTVDLEGFRSGSMNEVL